MSAAISSDYVNQAVGVALTAVFGLSVGQLPQRFRTGYTERAGVVLPGDCKLQITTQVEGWETSDSNTGSQVRCTTLVTVARCIIADWDEILYRGDHMLWSQERLLNPATWRDLSTVFEVAETPLLDLEPERSGAIVRYRTRVSVILN